jgi:tetratricopeptide (TPR) repeat protein
MAAGAADDAALALMLRARTDFDRVEAQPFPNVQDTARCAQSQAQLLAVTRPAEVPLVRFRKGYCEMLDAHATGNRAEFRDAAQDFAQAMAAWPAGTRNQPAPPMSSGLEALSAIARFEAGADPHTIPDIKAGLDDAVNRAACPAGLMPARLCQDLLATARLWQGWLALRDGDLAGAGRKFQAFPDLAWNDWTEGLRASNERRYPEAASGLGKAVEAWSADRRFDRPGLVRLLGPQPDMEAARVELGSAQYLARDYRAALTTLDAAVKALPGDARAIFMRALARQSLGEPEAALADYQLASRTAFANPELPSASSQAHYYRGVWHFRRKAYSQAEDEFSSALNAAPGPALKSDIVAWRQMAAVASGACGASSEGLRRAMDTASPFFPRGEAEGLLAGCGPAPANISSRQ